jgi:hypothetical protein
MATLCQTSTAASRRLYHKPCSYRCCGRRHNRLSRRRSSRLHVTQQHFMPCAGAALALRSRCTRREARRWRQQPLLLLLLLLLLLSQHCHASNHCHSPTTYFCCCCCVSAEHSTGGAALPCSSSRHCCCSRCSNIPGVLQATFPYAISCATIWQQHIKLCCTLLLLLLVRKRVFDCLAVVQRLVEGLLAADGLLRFCDCLGILAEVHVVVQPLAAALTTLQIACRQPTC